MAIILYGARTSPFVEKVYRGLLLKQLPFESHQPTSLLDLRRANPITGKMPVLYLDGERFYDSSLILRALEAYKPIPALLDADPHRAAQQRLLEDWADESLYWYGMAFRWAIPANATKTVERFQAGFPLLVRPFVKWVLPRILAAQVRAQGTGRLPLEVLQQELDSHMANLESLLGRGPFFFEAEQPSIADVAVFSQLSFLRATEVTEAKAIVERYSQLMDFYRLLNWRTA